MWKKQPPPRLTGIMRQPSLDQAFWALMFFIHLLQQGSGSTCDKDDYVINVMMMNDSEFPVTSMNIKPAVELGLKILKYDLKGKCPML